MVAGSDGGFNNVIVLAVQRLSDQAELRALVWVQVGPLILTMQIRRPASGQTRATFPGHLDARDRWRPHARCSDRRLDRAIRQACLVAWREVC